jgi:signal transduction histidine kinase
MTSPKFDYFNLGLRLNLAFVVLIIVILGGNGLVIWQFHMARIQTNRLTGGNQQLIAVLQLQVSLLLFHQRLDDLARSGDARRFRTEVQPLRRTLGEETQRVGTAVAALPSAIRVDPTFMPILEAIQITLPGQLDAVNELAESGDWGAIQRRLGIELKPIEMQTSLLVDSIDQQASGELTQAVAKMTSLQNEILIVVPATAICTFLLAGFVGWSVARRFIELRLEAGINERTRIARELHDNLIQSVTGLGLQIGGISKIVTAPESAKQRLQDLRAQVEDCLREARQYVWDIRSPESESIDLVIALKESGEQLTVGKGIRFSSLVDGIPRPISTDVRQQLLRIGREAIGNAARHARATQIEARLRFDAGKICLRVSDDGCGFDMDEGARLPGHFGLATMRERAAQIHASIQVSSIVGHGTCIEVAVANPD